MKKANPSRTLKIKAKIYKYTGLFLAHKEQLEFVTSKEFWKALLKGLKHKNNDMGLISMQGLLIGMWQHRNGFHRPSNLLRFKRPKWFFRTVAWFHDLYTVIKWDIQDLFK